MVEETLNAMLDAEADPLCPAERHERIEAWKELQTKVGEITLKVPKLCKLLFQPIIKHQ
jgi:transposase-like protein